MSVTNLTQLKNIGFPFKRLFDRLLLVVFHVNYFAMRQSLWTRCTTKTRGVAIVVDSLIVIYRSVTIIHFLFLLDLDINVWMHMINKSFS